MKNTKLLSTLLNASIAAFFNSLPVYLWTSLAQGFSAAVAVLITQPLCLSRHTKQLREGRLKQKLAHTQIQVDTCNSARLEYQFLPRGSSHLSGPLFSCWKLELEGKSSSWMMLPSISWWQETAEKAPDNQAKFQSRVFQVKQGNVANARTWGLFLKPMGLGERALRLQKKTNTK